MRSDAAAPLPRTGGARPSGRRALPRGSREGRRAAAGSGPGLQDGAGARRELVAASSAGSEAAALRGLARPPNGGHRTARRGAATTRGR